MKLRLGDPEGTGGVLRRSVLEVPGNVGRLLEKATAFDVDVLMLDLEDSVPNDPRQKQVARKNIAEAVRTGEFRARELVVRVNRPGHAWCLEDLRLVCELDIDGIVVPKVYAPAEYLFVEHYLDLMASDAMFVHLAVETPASLVHLPEIVSSASRLTSLFAGAFDYMLELGSSELVLGTAPAGSDDGLGVLRQVVLAVARAYGLTAIDAQLVSNPNDVAEMEAVARRSRAAGFDGGAAYHPNQVDVCNRIFSPDADQLTWARDVVAATAAARESGRAAVIHNGAVLLPQHEKLARSMIDLAATVADRTASNARNDVAPTAADDGRPLASPGRTPEGADHR